MSSAVEEKVIDIYNDHFYDSGSVHINGTKDFPEVPII
jgi:hypothetical protein